MQFAIDTKSGVPFYRQIIEQTKFAIASGDLAPGDRLPTVRQLAVDLSVNPNTVIRAYRELEIEGVLNTQQGSGTFVSEKRPEVDPTRASADARSDSHRYARPGLRLRTLPRRGP